MRSTLKLTILFMLLMAASLTFGVLPDNLILTIADVTGDGSDDHIVLAKRSVRAPGMKVYEFDGSSYTEISVPQVRTYRGYVQEDRNIQVNATIEPGNILQANLNDGRNGTRVENITVSIGSGGSADPGTGNVVVPLTQDRISPTPRGYVIPKYTMRRFHVGVTIQNDYYVAFGSVEAAIARMEQRVNDADHFYARDMGMAWEIQEIVVCTGTDPGNWGAWWSDQHTYVNSRIRFKAPGGAGSSGNVFSATNINQQHSCSAGSLSQYARSLGHEVGHGFGAGHNSCWSDIMGGSQSCLGLSTVQRMIDHSHVALEAASPKLLYGGDLAPYAMEDGANVLQGETVDIDLLENDYDGNGDAISLVYVESPTAKGAIVKDIGGGVVRYTPDADFLGEDTFVYHVADSGGITNRNGYVKVYVRNGDLATHIVFDETSGTLVSDIGPYQAHGTLTDGLSFSTSTDGKIGNALQCNSVDDKQSADFHGIGDPMDGDMSVSLWVRYPTAPTEEGVLICKGAAVIPSRFKNPRGGWAIGHVNGSGFRFTGGMQRDSWQSPEQFDRTSIDAIESNTWYHLVMVLDRTNKIVRGWVNNSEITNSVLGTKVPDGMIESSHLPLVIFDCEGQQDQGLDTPCIIDDVRIYNKVLSDQEIGDLYAANDDIPAGAPKPTDGDREVLAGSTLSWMPGKLSPTYAFDVYLGTNWAAVANATKASTEYKGSTGSIASYIPSTEADREYFWRVDEVKADLIVIPGRIWRFDTGGSVLFDPPLKNAGFEDVTVEPSETISGVQSWYDTSYTYTTWAGYDPAKYSIANGNNWVELGNAKWIYQQIGYWTPNVTYNIYALLGKKVGSTFRGAEISLWAGGNAQVASDGTSLATVGAVKIASTGLVKPSFTVPDSAAIRKVLSTGTSHGVGEPLWLQIEQGGGNGRTLVDNIQIAIPLDGGKGFLDFALFAAQWQRNDCGLCGGADLIGDGNVGLDDLATFVIIWLR